MADLQANAIVPVKSYDEEDAIEMTEETQPQTEENAGDDDAHMEPLKRPSKIGDIDADVDVDETTQLSIPQSPMTPAPKPPSSYAISVKSGVPDSPGLLDSDTKTPASTAPKPPAYLSRHHSSAALLYNPNPVLHDYTHMACCLIFFFWFIPCTSILAYIKAKAAVTAYNVEEYDEYKKLNRQSRLYMILSVGMTMILILIAVLVVVFVLEGEDPTMDELPTRDDQS